LCLLNFVMHKNLLAFLDGLDRYNENFIVDDHISRVAQLPDVVIDKLPDVGIEMIL
jgi:hypothetical protein